MSLTLRAAARAAAALMLLLAAFSAATATAARASASSLALAQQDEDDDVSGGDDEVYESARYGYTITYDPAEWEVVQGDADPDDQYDKITFSNGVSLIVVFGDPRYDADNLDECIDFYGDFLEFTDRGFNIEPRDEPGAADEEDGRAWATYTWATYTFTVEDEDVDERDFVGYFECIWFGVEPTIVIYHEAPVGEFEDEIEAREAFVAGIEPAAGADDEDRDAEDADAAEGEGASEDEETGDADLAVYESPHYGYTVTYDPVEWEVYEEDQDPDDEFDYVEFANGGERSYIALVGNPWFDEDELAECVDGYVDALEDSEVGSDVEPLGERGAAGEENGRAWATYTFTVEDEDGREWPNARYIECRWLGDGVTLVVLHNTLAEDYEEETKEREAFLAGIEAAAGAADEGDDREDLAVYESPQYGYIVTYDPDEWEVLREDPNPNDEYDAVTFTNGPSVLVIVGNPDYDEDEVPDCVEDYVDALRAQPGTANVEPLDEPEAAGEADGRAWATNSFIYELDDGSQADRFQYEECRWLGGGVTLVIRHGAWLEDYEEEVEAREAFVDGIEAAD